MSQTKTTPTFISDLNRFAAIAKFIYGYPEWELERSQRVLHELHEKAKAEISQIACASANVLLMNAVTSRFKRDAAAVKRQLDDNGDHCLLAMQTLGQYESDPHPELLKALEYQVEFLKRPFQI